MESPNKPDVAAPTEPWSGKPSQLVNIKAYIFGLLLLVAAAALMMWRLDVELALKKAGLDSVIPYLTYIALGLSTIAVLYVLFRYIVVNSESYRLRDGALEFETGILSKRTDVLDLFRVRDVTETRPLLMRLCGLGNIRIVSSDASTPVIELRAIHGSPKVLQLLRGEVNRSRQKNRVLMEENN